MANNSRDYAFLMIRYNTPQAIEKVWELIDKNDLYLEEERPEDFGIEKETHVTVVPCLDNDVDIEEIKGMLSPIAKYNALFSRLSIFDNPQYDVLKVDVHCRQLNNTNSKVLNKFTSHSEYKDYHPHATVAYLKKGCGQKYLDKLTPSLYPLISREFMFSYHKDGEEKVERFK